MALAADPRARKRGIARDIDFKTIRIVECERGALASSRDDKNRLRQLRPL